MKRFIAKNIPSSAFGLALLLLVILSVDRTIMMYTTYLNPLVEQVMLVQLRELDLGYLL